MLFCLIDSPKVIVSLHDQCNFLLKQFSVQYTTLWLSLNCNDHYQSGSYDMLQQPGLPTGKKSLDCILNIFLHFIVQTTIRLKSAGKF